MIIRLTVNDNDFTPSIEKFADNLLDRLLTADIDSEMSTEERLLVHDQWQRVFKLLNPNVTSSITVEDETFLNMFVCNKWNKYVENTILEEETRKYLKDNFKAQVGFSYVDKWENGEAVYYSTKAGKWITQ